MQRWSNSNNNATTPSAVTDASSVDTANDSSVDPFLLDFGTSVNVTEDLCRGIRAEIQEIDTSISKVTNFSKQEERVEGQLKQDISHAHCEMLNLSRGATDRLEDAGVHTGFLTSLDHTLQTDLVVSTGVVLLGRSRSPTCVMEHPDNSQDVVDSSDKASKIRTNKEIYKEKDGSRRKLFQSIAAINKDADALFQEKKAKTQEIERINEAVKANGLTSNLEQAREKAEHLQVDVKDESLRKKSMMETMQLCRSRCGANAQLVAEKTKQINALRNQNSTEHQENSKLVSAQATKVAQKEAGLSDNKSRLSLVSSQIERCRKELQDFESFDSAKKSRKEELQQEAEEGQKLLSLIEELTSQKEFAAKELAESRAKVQNAQKLELGVVQEKETNDKMEVSMFLPGQEEIVQLSKKKEALATRINEQHSEMVSAQSREKEEVAALSESKQKISDILANRKEALEGKRVKRLNTESIATEQRENLEREIGDWNKTTEKNTLKHAAKDAEIKQEDEKFREAASKKIKEAKLEARYRKVEEELHLETMGCGRDVIESARETTKNLEEFPIPL